jgi:hypothetical protein
MVTNGAEILWYAGINRRARRRQCSPPSPSIWIPSPDESAALSGQWLLKLFHWLRPLFRGRDERWHFLAEARLCFLSRVEKAIIVLRSEKFHQ